MLRDRLIVFSVGLLVPLVGTTSTSGESIHQPPVAVNKASVPLPDSPPAPRKANAIPSRQKPSEPPMRPDKPGNPPSKPGKPVHSLAKPGKVLGRPSKPGK
jgi:hypothetical protein